MSTAPPFVDANVFLRLITTDHPEHAARSVAFFERIRSGEQQMTTSESVLAEVVYVLASRLYLVPRDQVRGQLAHLLSLRGVRLPQRSIILRALDLFVGHPRLDFEDALSVAHVEHSGAPAIVSFDRDFDRVPGLVRQEP